MSVDDGDLSGWDVCATWFSPEQIYDLPVHFSIRRVYLILFTERTGTAARAMFLFWWLECSDHPKSLRLHVNTSLLGHTSQLAKPSPPPHDHPRATVGPTGGSTGFDERQAHRLGESGQLLS